MKFAVALCLMAVAVSAAKLKPSLRSQVGGVNFPVILNNTLALEGALAAVSVACSGGLVSLNLTNTQAVTEEAQIVIGSGCRSARQGVGAAGLVYGSTSGDNCGRSGNSYSYTWSVQITEWFPRPSGLVLGPFIATFDVECSFDADQPEATPAFPEPPPVNEGNAEFTGTVGFTLEISTASTDRQWVLELEPASVASLRGLSYTINNLVASTGDGSGGRLTANLIRSGCIEDRLGVQVTQGSEADQRSTIRVTAFQFSARPGALIDFNATVLLCTPAAPGGVCAPVKDEANCPAPIVPPVPAVTTVGPVPEPEEETTPEAVVEPEVTEGPVIPEEPETEVPVVEPIEPVEPVEPVVPEPEGPEARRTRRSPNKRFGIPIGRLVVKTFQ